ncbi:MAG TPA: flagellar motor switch protein FliG [Desulfobacteraceae bacterium]|nr:flagellar motor switch protein FliG [Desulfobacteraceae bacterium]
MNPKDLPGSLKVAILIQSLGKEISQRILKYLNGTERELIESHLSQMGTISPDVVELVAREFIEMITRESDGHPRSLPLSEGGERTEESSLSSTSESSNLKILQTLAGEDLIELIKDEHPQTIAIILLHLKTRVAGEVLSKLPDEIKTDVAFRIANLDKVLPGMVEEIDKVFEDVLKKKDAFVPQVAGGVNRLAEILNQADQISGELILNEIEEVDAELADQIKQRMFTFEDLRLVDDRGLQKVLRRVETRELAIALKAASEEVREKIFRNMSERASEMLREEMEVMGAVRMREVEDAQQTITKIIQDMETKGELIISGRRGEELIG